MAVSSQIARQLVPRKLFCHTSLNYYNNHYHDQQKMNHYNNVSSKSCLRPAIVMRVASPHSDTNVAVIDRAAGGTDIPRPVTLSFGRSPWAEDVFESKHGDHHKKVEEDYVGAIELLKESVRRMLTDNEEYIDEPRDKLVLIDTLERLDIAYQFEDEIEDQIRRIYDHYLRIGQHEDGDVGVDDLFTTALYFRMFRQHGYKVSSSVFDKYRDEDNKFKKTLCNDIEGLLSLYEASFLRFHREDELKEARDFATHHLNEAKDYLEDSSSYLKDKVDRALLQPLHWALPKVEARNYISIYEKMSSKDETLLRLAKLDFHVMQSLYKKEMHELQKWWYGFGLMSKLPYARDSVVPSYFWASALSYEPKYSRSRVSAAKAIVIGTLINDTYDNYATLEEVQALTDIMQRLDTTDVDNLPNYMKIVYDAFLHTLDEYEQEASEQGRSYMDSYIKETFREMAVAYHKKAKWYKGDERPRFRDHVDSMGITSGIHQMLSVYYIHVESASKAVSEWLETKPSYVENAALYCRYLNDISSYERERGSGLYPTSVDCYMVEEGASMQETKDKFAELAEGCWMSLNEEWVEMNNDLGVSKELLKPAINYARAMFACYGHGLDCFSRPEKGLDSSINALLIDPIFLIS